MTLKEIVTTLQLRDDFLPVCVACNKAGVITSAETQGKDVYYDAVAFAEPIPFVESDSLPPDSFLCDDYLTWREWFFKSGSVVHVTNNKINFRHALKKQTIKDVKAHFIRYAGECRVKA